MDFEFEENITQRGVKKRGRPEAASAYNENLKTTTTRRCATMSCDELKSPIHVLRLESEPTPRRSGRKSVKPVQDYDEIVIGRSGRKLQSSKIELLQLGAEELDETQPKWTPAKVGRVSQKRPARKSSKKTKRLKKLDEQNKKFENFDFANAEEESDRIEDDVFSANVQTSDVLNTTFDKTEIGKNTENGLTEQMDFTELRLVSIDDSKAFCKEDAHVSGNFQDKKSKSAVTPTTIKNNESIALQSKIQEEILSDESQDMPSLVLCDDDDQDLEDHENLINAEGDDTFNASDCIIISPTGNNAPESLGSQKIISPSKNVDSPLVEAAKKVKKLQTKYFTPNEVKSSVLPQIVVSLSDQHKRNINNIEKTMVLADKKAIRGTPGSAAKRNPGGTATPKSDKREPGYHFLTPFKTKMDLNFSEIGKGKDSFPSTMSKVPIITTLEPREIVLCSIRKRSLSVAVNGEEHKRKGLNVTFYSPANQTATTEDLDKLISNNAFKPQEQNQNKIKIIRKRSISLDENALRFPFKLPRRVKTPTKTCKSPSKLTTRTKIPNFAAIHEKQFQKMENLVDYVARKAERAQNLTNSALKAKNGILSKEIPSISKTKALVPRALPLAAIGSTKKESLDKLKERRERHLNMLKGRADSKTDKRRTNIEFIKGVRSNRRFELLMQHRKTSGN